MKKSFAITILALSISFASLAQSSASFEKGTNVLNAGIGLGNVYWGSGYGNSGLPFSLNASFEHGITEKLGIGYVGVGAQVGYASQKYSFDGQTAWRSTGILFAARGSYHFAIPSDIGEKLDPYAGLMLGYVATSYSYSDGYNDGGKTGRGVVGFYAGAHYHFNPHFGVYAELGYTSFSILSLGVALRF